MAYHKMKPISANYLKQMVRSKNKLKLKQKQ